jgi:hypothetical protein
VLSGVHRLEGDDPFDLDWRPERVAVVAAWSARPRLSRSLCRLVEELRAAEFDVVLVSACEDERPLDWPTTRPDRVRVVRKDNIGYDFGSWSLALQLHPRIAQADYVLFANDSMVGPFRSLEPLLGQFIATHADVWGLTDSAQFGRHLQSYFMGYRHGVLTAPVLARFWAGLRIEPSKDDLIQRAEVGLSRILQREGYAMKAAFPYQRIAPDGENPTIRQWERLLDRGFPFVKREVIRSPEVAAEGDRAPEVILNRFGERVEEWL